MYRLQRKHCRCVASHCYASPPETSKNARCVGSKLTSQKVLTRETTLTLKLMLSAVYCSAPSSFISAATVTAMMSGEAHEIVDLRLWRVPTRYYLVPDKLQFLLDTDVSHVQQLPPSPTLPRPPSLLWAAHATCHLNITLPHRTLGTMSWLVFSP